MPEYTVCQLGEERFGRARGIKHIGFTRTDISACGWIRTEVLRKAMVLRCGHVIDGEDTRDVVCMYSHLVVIQGIVLWRIYRRGWMNGFGIVTGSVRALSTSRHVEKLFISGSYTLHSRQLCDVCLLALRFGSGLVTKVCYCLCSPRHNNTAKTL